MPQIFQRITKRKSRSSADGAETLRHNEMKNNIINEKNKVEMILQNLADGVIAFDAEQQVIHMNTTAAEILRIPRENPGIMFDELFEKLGVNIRIAEFLFLERERTVERRIQMDGGLIAAKFVPFKMENAKPAGVIVVLNDITEQFEVEKSRRKFVADVSHELRTPLTTIKTYAETLRVGDVDSASQEEFLRIIEDETDKMTRIVKDLLELSSFDSARAVLRRTYFSLDRLLKSTVETFLIEAKNNSQTLTYSATTELPAQIFADRDKIEQVITNLISNAMKYSGDDGVIEVFAGKIYNEIYIKVRDNGIGIPKKDLPYLFDRFFRVNKARTRNHGGTGLGLAIVKEIITTHGGTIKIDSEYGRYTEVVITLPAAPPV